MLCRIPENNTWENNTILTGVWIRPPSRLQTKFLLLPQAVRHLHGKACLRFSKLKKINVVFQLLSYRYIVHCCDVRPAPAKVLINKS
jgi:hypothetical protein